MSIWPWCEFLTAIAPEHRLSLGEGQTPLIPSRCIGPSANLASLCLKLESSNPSGSYKDRFAASAVSHMRANGQRVCVATSSGNTGSALAAYCAAVGIACRIAIVETAPAAKLLQMAAYGAQLYRVRGFGIDPAITEQTFDSLFALSRSPGAALQISAFKYSPLGMAGVETIAFEIASQCERVAHVFVPAGGGGLTLAVARGFQRFAESQRLDRLPKVHCVQPKGNDTIAGPLRGGAKRAQSVQCTTKISGLQVPSVIDGDKVIAACRQLGGNGYSVSDEEVFTAQRRLAQEEGIFCEPAAAVSVAGALAAAARGEIQRDDVVVCLITGTGFKDWASIEQLSSDVDVPTIDLANLNECMMA